MQSSPTLHTQDGKKWYVIKLGGSILVPDLPDTEFLKEFRELIHDRVTTHGEKFLIIVGGGKTFRNYRDSLHLLGMNEEVQDWAGVFCIRFHAEFLRLIFESLAHPVTFNFPSEVPETITAPVVICGADIPGHSSNHDAVMFAHAFSSNTILNLSNIDYVYDADPRKVPTALKYETVSWKQYRTFIPAEWQPGLSTPFDPVSSSEAQELNIDVVFMKGNPVSNLKHYLETGEVQGTIISNRFE